jgi:hypothetical protein
MERADEHIKLAADGTACERRTSAEQQRWDDRRRPQR